MDQSEIERKRPSEQLTEQELEQLSLHGLFHRLWTKAVGTAGYNKNEWMELEQRVAKLQQRDSVMFRYTYHKGREEKIKEDMKNIHNII